MRDGKTEEAPDQLKDRDLSRALFGALKEQLNDPGFRSGVVREGEMDGPDGEAAAAVANGIAARHRSNSVGDWPIGRNGAATTVFRLRNSGFAPC